MNGHTPWALIPRYRVPKQRSIMHTFEYETYDNDKGKYVKHKVKASGFYMDHGAVVFRDKDGEFMMSKNVSTVKRIKTGKSNW